MSEGTSSAPPSKKVGAPLSYVWGLQYERGQRSSSSHKNDAKCTRCGIVLLSATVFQAEEHILHCEDALEENKEAVYAARAKKAGDVVPPLPGNSLATKLDMAAAAKQSMKQGGMEKHVGRRLSEEDIQQQHIKLLRWAVASGVPFRAFDSWHWNAFVHSLNDSYPPPSSQTLSTRVLAVVYTELLAYQKNLPPFNQPWSMATTPRTYWQTLDNDTDASVIASLALLLHSVVPSAATPERVFSFVEITTDSNNRHNLHPRTLHKMASVKQYLAGEQPEKFTVAAAPAAKQRRAATSSSSSSGKAPAKQRKLTLVPGGQLTLAPLQQGSPAAATGGSDQQLQRLPSGMPPAGPSSSPHLGMLPWAGAYPTAGVQQQHQQQLSPMAPALPAAGMSSSAALTPPTAGTWAGVQQQPHPWSDASPSLGQQAHGALSSSSSVQPSSMVGWGTVTPQQSWLAAGAAAPPDGQQLPAASTGGGSIIAPLEGAAAAAVGNPADGAVRIDLTTEQQEQPDAETGDGDMDQHDLGAALDVAWARDQEEEEELQRMAASEDVGPAFEEQVEIAKKYTKACGFMWLLTAEWEGYSLVQPEHLHPKAQPVPVQPLPAAKKKRFDDEDQVDDAMFG